jgi:ABC-2 type transport system permease protein
MTVLLVLKVPLFGFTVSGSLAALGLLTSLAMVLSAFGMAITALARTSQQLNALGSVGGFVLGMLGGAFVPVAAMPGWAQAIGPFMPTYWAMRGMRSVVIDSCGIGDVVAPVLVMLGKGLLLAVFAATRFRFQDTKIYYG